MAKLTKTDMSCGVYMLEDLGGRNDSLLRRIMAGYKRQALDQGRQLGFAQVVWSDADFIGMGEEFKRYLNARYKNNKIVSLRHERSPTTGNDITTYVWNIPHAMFRNDPFYKKVKAKEHDHPHRGVTRDNPTVKRLVQERLDEQRWGAAQYRR